MHQIYVRKSDTLSVRVIKLRLTLASIELLVSKNCLTTPGVGSSLTLTTGNVVALLIVQMYIIQAHPQSAAAKQQTA